VATLGVGVIGVGVLGRMHAENVQWRIHNARVTAIADVRADVARSVAEQLGVPKVYATADEVAADPDVDAIVIVSSDVAHAEGIIAGARHRKAIFCEKPITTTLEDADRALAAVEEAGVKNAEIPDCSVAKQKIDTGSKAECFARYIRVHALEATGGQVYAEMPRAVDKKTQKPIPDDQAAAALENGTAIDNPQRDTWVTATALSTAMNTSYFAEQVANFSIVVGIALILIGIGLLVLTYGALRPQLATRE